MKVVPSSNPFHVNACAQQSYTLSECCRDVNMRMKDDGEPQHVGCKQQILHMLNLHLHQNAVACI